MKPWYTSKSVWLNIILSMIGILTLVAEYMTNNPALTAPGLIMLVVGALGVILRIWFTDVPIETPARLVIKQKNIEAYIRRDDGDSFGPR
jgi:membrane-bound ClpP family serine protease